MVLVTRFGGQLFLKNLKSWRNFRRKLTVACKEKSINILEIQKEGKNKMMIEDFLLGTKKPQGKSRLMFTYQILVEYDGQSYQDGKYKKMQNQYKKFCKKY